MLYTDVQAKATAIEPDDELLAELYDGLGATRGIEAPSVSADIVDRIVYVRADVDAPTRVDADRLLVMAFGAQLERVFTGSRVSYVVPALAGE